MTDPTPPSGVASAKALRTLAFALVTAPVYVLVAVWFSAPEAEKDLPTVVAAATIAIVLSGWLLAETIGYRTAPLDFGDDARVAMQRYQTSMILRFVLTEAPVILGIAAAFALPYGPWPAVVAVLVGLPSMAFHVWPTRRAVSRFAARLEAAGAPSGLREAFGHR